MERKGRPPSSEVRKNLIDLLYISGPLHCYEIAKHYNKIFSKVTQRLIYYHLKKGVEYEIIKIKGVEKVDSGYSWGPQAERILYELTSKANPSVNDAVKEYFDKIKSS